MLFFGFDFYGLKLTAQCLKLKGVSRPQTSSNASGEEKEGKETAFERGSEGGCCCHISVVCLQQVL